MPVTLIRRETSPGEATGVMQGDHFELGAPCGDSSATQNDESGEEGVLTRAMVPHIVHPWLHNLFVTI